MSHSRHIDRKPNNEIIDFAGVKFKISESDAEYLTDCIFCGSEFALALKAETQRCFCIKCKHETNIKAFVVLAFDAGEREFENQFRAERRKVIERNCKKLGWEHKKLWTPWMKQKNHNKPIKPHPEWTKQVKQLLSEVEDLSNPLSKYRIPAIKAGGKRGLTHVTIDKHDLKYNPPELNLSWKPIENKNEQKIDLPPGLVLTINRDYVIIRVIIMNKKGIFTLPGSINAPMWIKTKSKEFIVVESEFELLLLEQISSSLDFYSRYPRNLIAIGDAELEPDHDLHLKLRNADSIDFFIGSENEEFPKHIMSWFDVYPQAEWRPFKIGRNLFEARKDDPDFFVKVRNLLT